MSGRRSRRAASEIAHRWVAAADELDEIVEAALAEDSYAIDTEFHRERTYFPHLALLQLAWGDEVVLIDPLAIELAPLAELFAGSGVAVMHAGSQDLEVLDRSVGSVPRRLFDTQVASGFVGYSTPSLSSLVDGELGRRLPKGDRLTDWLARPLGQAQRSYAASDVAYLLELHERLVAELDRLDRRSWAEAECQELLERPRQPQDPGSAWTRIKEVKHLRGEARVRAKRLAAWRERTAAATDSPVRFVLSDLALVGVAQAAPADEASLRAIRGVDGRHLRDGAAARILEAMSTPFEGEEAAETPSSKRVLDRELKPAVALISAWVNQLARDERLDSALLATRGDLEALLRGDPTARLRQGWRHELLGRPIDDLVAGRAALAFEAGTGLVLEQRSASGNAETRSP